MVVVVLFLVYWFLFPVRKINRNSRVCHTPALFQNTILCHLAGCIYGSGDLTGPPFCGAYK